MVSKGEEELRQALQGVLDLYNIQIDHIEDEQGHIDHSEVIGKAQDRIDDLNEQAEEIFKRTGMNREQLEAYASNPNNFSREQWEALQKVKEACENYRKEARAYVGEDLFEKKIQAKRQKKVPRRFAKKKHWIPL